MKKKNQGAGWQKRKRTLGHKRKRPERSRQHTQYNARIDTHSKPSRTPGNVSHTVLYDAIFLPRGTACTDFNSADEARATYRKPLFSRSSTFTIENTRTPGRCRSTNDSVMKSERSSLVRGSELPKCHSAHTSVGDMWRGPARRLIKKHSSLGKYMMTIGTQEGFSGQPITYNELKLVQGE